MARWEVKIEIPVPGDNPPIAPIVLTCFGEGGYRRSELGWADISEFTQDGHAVLEGPVTGIRYVWNFAVDLTEAEALQLGALAKWQNRTYSAKQNGALKLTDEIEYLDPEPNPHPKTLLTPIAAGPNYAAGYVYGFGVFNVKLQISEEHRQQRGRLPDDQQAKLFQFRALEV